MRPIFFLLTALLLPGTASANAIMFGPPHAVSVDQTSTKVANQNSLRRYLIIVNKSSTLTVYVKFQTVQGSTSEGIPIPPGGNYEPFGAPSNSFYLVTPSSTATAVWMEGQ